MNRSLFSLSAVLAMIGCLFFSCEQPEVEANFEDQEDKSIYAYLMENQETYSSFIRILEAGGIDKTLSAYNPDNIGYTLFLPGNDAINEFIAQNNQFNSLDELISDKAYSGSFSRYHVVNQAIDANEFPFGALPEFTLSNDYLTVSFVAEQDTSYFKINNQAPVIRPNIEVSNGFIHILGSALNPITFTSYEYLAQHSGYSIFKDAVDATGLVSLLDLNTKDETQDSNPFTLLLEHDTVFQKAGINSFADLASRISAGNTNYTNALNPVNTFVRYHMLEGSRFLDDFNENATNYSTYSDVPININGLGLDILINKGKLVYDTLINGQDTTFINYVGFNIDASNVLTQSGSIHLIDRILWQQRAGRAIQNFSFFEEPLFNEFRQEQGSFIVDDSSALQRIKYSGSDLTFVKSGDPQHPAWNGDFIWMDGDFTISYRIPRMVQGKYDVFLGAETLSSANAVVEVFIDGKNVGGIVDLSKGGSGSNPFARKELGTIDFVKYEEHTITIKTLIPGRLLWDYIRFEPFTN